MSFSFHYGVETTTQETNYEATSVSTSTVRDDLQPPTNEERSRTPDVVVPVIKEDKSEKSRVITNGNRIDASQTTKIEDHFIFGSKEFKRIILINS